MLAFLLRSKMTAANDDSFLNRNLNTRLKRGLIILLPFIAILAQAPFIAVKGQIPIPPVIVLTALSVDTICQSSTQTRINVRGRSGDFAADNVFTARLINGTDTLVIGTRKDTRLSSPPIIKSYIPAGLPAGTYLIDVISSNPVVTSTTALTLTISDLPGPTLTLTKQDVSGCGDGTDGIITGVASGGTTPYAFTFFPPGGTRVPTATSLTVSNLGVGDYTMQVRGGNGCVTRFDTSLIQQPLPTIEVSTKGNVSACDDSKLGFFTMRVFPRDSTIATGIKPFSWTINGAPASAEPEPKAPYKFNEPVGTYSITMTDAAGCASNTIDNIEIGKDTAVGVYVGSFQRPSCGASDGEMVVFARYGSHSSYRYSYSTDGGINYSTPQSGHRFTGLAAGDYLIKATDSRGCDTVLNFTLPAPANCLTGVVATSKDNLNAAGKSALSVQALPNPSRSTFTLNLQSSSKETVRIIVMDMVGKKVYQTTGVSNQQYTFGSEFTSGMYIVQVIQGKQVQTLKLVKE